MSKELRIVAPFHTASSFPRHARGILRTALLAGYVVEAVETDTHEIVTGLVSGEIIRTKRPIGDINESPLPQREELMTALRTNVAEDAPTIILNSPPVLIQFGEFSSGPRIGVTMIESDRVHPRMVNAMRNCDVLCAPSPFCARTFDRDVGPTRVFPVPIDDRLWSPEGQKLEIPDRPEFLFTAVFAVSERKNWRVLLQAFAEEFKGEDVGLYCQVNGHVEDIHRFASECRNLGAWIRVESRPKSYDDLAGLYRASQCYVLPSSEGFGMPFAEAALCGVPSAGLIEGGQAELVDYGIPVEWAPTLGFHPNMFPSNQLYPSCACAALRTTLRQAYDDIVIRGEIPGQMARRRVLEKYTPLALVDTLNAIVTQAQREFHDKQTPKPTETWGGVAGLAVAILSHNHIEATKACIESVKRTAPFARIILADHASSDGTPEWARGEGVEVIDCGIDGNMSRNRNRILEAVGLESYVAFLDNDVTVSDGWAEKLRRILDDNPNMAAISAWNDIPIAEWNSHCGTFLREGGRFELCRLKRHLCQVDTVSGSCFMIRPEIAGLFMFDEDFPFWNEDWDYGLTLRKNLWDCGGTYDVRVIHNHNTTSPERKAEAEPRNRQFLRKWREYV